MSILANALPGFREVRAALVAGYLWLLFGWLLLGETLTKERDAGTVRNLVDLATAAGEIWTALAIGVAAYLVGLISRDMSRGLATMVRRLLSLRWELAEATVSERRARRQEGTR